MMLWYMYICYYVSFCDFYIFANLFEFKLGCKPESRKPVFRKYGHPYADGVGCLPGSQKAATSPYCQPYVDGIAVGVESLAPASGGAGLSGRGMYADGIAVGVGSLPDAQVWGRAVRKGPIRRRHCHRRITG